MSIRTIIEINHDYLGDMTPRMFEELILVLKNGDMHSMNSNREFRGLRYLAQRHHSTKITVQVE